MGISVVWYAFGKQTHTVFKVNTLLSQCFPATACSNVFQPIIVTFQ